MNIQKNIYAQCLNRVLNYIRTHIAEDISVDTLADVAGFSPFHFHRIFTGLMGETVNQCVVRLRLERAIALMKSNPNQPITHIAEDCGFLSLSVFSRTFKKQFGISPSQWNRVSPLNNSKNGQHEIATIHYTMDDMLTMQSTDTFDVQVRSLPAQTIAYIRVIDAYTEGRIEDAYQGLIQWYQSNGGELSQSTLLGMSQDDPDIVPMSLCRYDVCLTVPNHWTTQDEISIRSFPACTIATIHCDGNIDLIDRAIQYLYRYWLPNSPYLPANLPGIEIYRKQPYEIGWDVYDLECAIPIVPIDEHN
ncbi:MAG: AraC family transcriptional regulator [Chloroflexota bacterium]